jgi:hypothetical protein
LRVGAVLVAVVVVVQAVGRQAWQAFVLFRATRANVGKPATITLASRLESMDGRGGTTDAGHGQTRAMRMACLMLSMAILPAMYGSHILWYTTWTCYQTHASCPLEEDEMGDSDLAH